MGQSVSMFDIGDVVFYAGTSSRPGANAEYHAVDERLIAKTPKIFLPKRVQACH